MKPKINSHIIDLFMSLDFADCALINGNGDDIGYNMNGVYKEAIVFLSHLKDLDVENLPSADDLVETWRQF